MTRDVEKKVVLGPPCVPVCGEAFGFTLRAIDLFPDRLRQAFVGRHRTRVVKGRYTIVLNSTDRRCLDLAVGRHHLEVVGVRHASELCYDRMQEAGTKVAERLYVGWWCLNTYSRHHNVL
jgi:hypothetical protein